MPNQLKYVKQYAETDDETDYSDLCASYWGTITAIDESIEFDVITAMRISVLTSAYQNYRSQRNL